METRTDVLVAEARRLVMFERKKGWMLEEDIDIIRRLADALEAATGGQHVESKHWAEVGRLRSENLRLRNESQAEAWFARLRRIRTAVELLGDDEITGSARRWLETTLDTIVKELGES